MIDQPSPRLRYWQNTILGPLVSGFCYVVAFEPFGLRPMIVVGLIGFLYSLRGLNAVEARRAGFLFGMVVMCVGCFWLKNIFGWLFVLLCAVQALFFALFGWGHAIVDRQAWGRWRKNVSIACVWTAVELVRAEHFWLDFPWMTPGHGLGVIQGLTQPLLAWIGVYGVGFVVVFIAAAMTPVDWKVRRRQHAPIPSTAPQESAPEGKANVGQWLPSRGARFGFVVRAVAISALLVFAKSNLMMNSHSLSADTRSIAVAAIQGEHGSLPDYKAASDTLATTPQLIVWPEEALPYDIKQSKREWTRLVQWVKDKNIVLVTGTQQAGVGEQWWNTALTLDAEGERGHHFKVHTVHLFNDGTPGTEAMPIQTKLGKIGTPICFDCDYQDVVRRMTLNGAEFFAVPSMDPIPWGPVQRQMHSELFRLRAAENGRAMVVCATSGVTQLIDAYGRHVKPPLAPFLPGVLEGTLPIRTEFTVFTRVGWLFPWAAMVATIGVLATARRVGKR